MTPVVPRDLLAAIVRAIFSIIAKVPELHKAEEHIIELLEDNIRRVVNFHHMTLTQALVDAITKGDLPTCRCGKRYVDRDTLARAIVNVLEAQGDAASKVN